MVVGHPDSCSVLHTQVADDAAPALGVGAARADHRAEGLYRALLPGARRGILADDVAIARAHRRAPAGRRPDLGARLRRSDRRGRARTVAIGGSLALATD